MKQFYGDHHVQMFVQRALCDLKLISCIDFLMIELIVFSGRMLGVRTCVICL